MPAGYAREAGQQYRPGTGAGSVPVGSPRMRPGRSSGRMSPIRCPHATRSPVPASVVLMAPVCVRCPLQLQLIDSSRPAGSRSSMTCCQHLSDHQWDVHDITDFIRRFSNVHDCLISLVKKRSETVPNTPIERRAGASQEMPRKQRDENGKASDERRGRSADHRLPWVISD